MSSRSLLPQVISFRRSAVFGTVLAVVPGGGGSAAAILEICGKGNTGAGFERGAGAGNIGGWLPGIHSHRYECVAAAAGVGPEVRDVGPVYGGRLDREPGRG